MVGLPYPMLRVSVPRPHFGVNVSHKMFQPPFFSLYQQYDEGIITSKGQVYLKTHIHRGIFPYSSYLCVIKSSNLKLCSLLCFCCLWEMRQSVCNTWLPTAVSLVIFCWQTWWLLSCILNMGCTYNLPRRPSYNIKSITSAQGIWANNLNLLVMKWAKRNHS